MKETDQKNEKLAYRLAYILSRLNQKERLSVEDLAEEFNTHTRTIFRDFNRLEAALECIGTPLQKDGQRYWLKPVHVGAIELKHLKNFAHVSGVEQLIQGLEKPTVLGFCEATPQTYEAKGYFFEDKSTFSSQIFKKFEQAIIQNQTFAFKYKNKVRVVEPYKIIHHRGCWYLAASRKQKLIAYRLSRIQLFNYARKLKKFKPQDEMLEQIKNETTIWFGHKKIEFILKINEEVADHFQQRQILPEQEIVTQDQDGSLLVLSRVAHPRQLLSLIRYWMPHIKIVSPSIYQKEFKTQLAHYLNQM